MISRQQTNFKSLQLTPGQDTSVNTTGKFFYVVSADGPFSIQFNDGGYFAARSGVEVNGFEFERVTFRSDVGTGGATITIKYYAGNVYVTNRNPLVYSAPVPSYIVPRTALLLNTTTFAIPSTNTRTGQPTADAQIYQRVFHMTAATYFEVYDTASNTLCGRVPSSDDKTFNVSSGLTLKAIGDGTYGIQSCYALPI